MSVTWGDLKNVTWGEMHKAGMTWGDAKTLTSREYFALLEKRLCALERGLDATPKEKRKSLSVEVLCNAISLALGIVSVGLALDAKLNPEIQREEMVSMMQI